MDPADGEPDRGAGWSGRGFRARAGCGGSVRSRAAVGRLSATREPAARRRRRTASGTRPSERRISRIRSSRSTTPAPKAARNPAWSAVNSSMVNGSGGSLRRFDTGTRGPEAGAICGDSADTIGGSATCGPAMPARGLKSGGVSGGTPGVVGLIPGGSPRTRM